MGDFFTKEQGTAAIEYALLVSLIGMAIIGSLQVLGSNVFDGLSTLDHVFSLTQLKDDLLPQP
jgi:Flp pilus assembly pilin Flp